jgi:hypothetical protein
LYAIAFGFGTHPDLICDANINFIRNCSNITAGDILRIPPTCVPVIGAWDCVPIPHNFDNPIIDFST